MVLQLCGRVCRRLSLWNPNLLGWGSFFLFERRVRKLGSLPLLRPFGYRLGSLNPHHLLGEDFFYFFSKNKMKFSPNNVVKDQS
jgi:hypothetical protein